MSRLISFRAGSGLVDLDGLIGAEEKVINSKSKLDENVVGLFCTEISTGKLVPATPSFLSFSGFC